MIKKHFFSEIFEEKNCYRIHNMLVKIELEENDCKYCELIMFVTAATVLQLFDDE